MRNDRVRYRPDQTCIYCGDPLGKGSGEHVIPSALGGQKETRSICCGDCNRRLGNEVDEPLVEGLVWISNFLDLRTGRGNRSGHDRSRAVLADNVPELGVILDNVAQSA